MHGIPRLPLKGSFKGDTGPDKGEIDILEKEPNHGPLVVEEVLCNGVIMGL